MTQVFAYRHAIPSGRQVDIDRLRHDAIIACYRKALDDGLYPVEKPTVELDLGDWGEFRGSFATMSVATLNVRVRCSS